MGDIIFSKIDHELAGKLASQDLVVTNADAIFPFDCSDIGK